MMSINEQALGKKVERDAERYMKQYSDYMNILESKSLLSKVRPIGAFDYYALGRQLEAWEVYHAMCEEDGSVSQLGKIPDIAMDIVTINYGTSPISVCATTQPIDEERGSIYYKKVVAQTTRGTVTQGDTLFGAGGTAPAHFTGYATERVTETFDTVNATTTYSVNVNALPIRPYTVKVTVPVSGGTTVTAQDNGEGKLVGYDIQGTIVYWGTTGGAVTIELKNNPGDSTDGIVIAYSQDMASADDIPKIIMKLATKSVDARIYALKDTIGLEQTYALRKRFGMIADDEVATDLIAAVNAEIMNTLTVKALASAQGNTDWAKAAPAGVSYFEHKQTFKDAIADAEATMIGNAGRGAISVIIAGRNICALISTLPGFMKISDGTVIGPHIYGTLDGITIVRITNASTLSANVALCIYNGTSPFESALVYAPYMPLVITSALPTGANPLMNQRAAAIWCAIESLVPQFITKITMT